MRLSQFLVPVVVGVALATYGALGVWTLSERAVLVAFGIVFASLGVLGVVLEVRQ